MMRMIKFRAWDHRNKIMIHDVLISSQMLLFPVKMSGDLLGIDGNKYFQVSRDAYHVMQLSGMTDNSGNEIYEGDIVKLTNVNGFTGIALVVYMDGCFIVEFEEPLTIFDGPRFYNKKRDYLKTWVINRAVEVIGNMYESPRGRFKEGYDFEIQGDTPSTL